MDDVYLPDGNFIPQCMGGDALYAALGARLWIPEVQLLAPLSPDIPGQTLAAMRTTGFDPEIMPVRDIPVIRNRIFYDAHGGRRWEVLASEEAFNILSPRPEDIPEHFCKAQSHLILAMSLDAQENLIQWLRKNTKSTLALDTQEDYVAGNEDRILSLVSLVDVFMPSAVEVVQLLGHHDWTVAAAEFANLGPKVVVIKLGAEGVLVFDRETGDRLEQESLAEKEVVDTTGAGDAFCGGFMAAYLLDPYDLKRAALAGTISASFAVASFGMDALLKAKPTDAYIYLQQCLVNSQKIIH